MFRKNISRLIKKQGLTYVTLGKRMGIERNARQLMSKSLTKSFWPLDRLKVLFSAIFDTPVKFGWKVYETGQIFYTDDMKDIVGAQWASLSVVQMSTVLGTTKNNARKKVVQNLFRKDEVIRAGAAIGVQMLICDGDGNILYAFDETDLSDTMPKKSR